MKKANIWYLAVALGGVVPGLFPAAVSAAPQVHVYGQMTVLYTLFNNLETREQYDNTFNGPLSGGFLEGFAGSGYVPNGQGSSGFDAYGFHAVANSSSSNTGLVSGGKAINSSGANVTATFSDVDMSAPAGANSPVPTYLNMHLGGYVNGSTQYPPNSFHTSLVVNIFIADLTTGQNLLNQRAQLGYITNGDTLITAVDPVFQPYQIGLYNSVNARFGPLMLPVTHDHLTMAVTLSAGADTGLSLAQDGYGTATVDFGNTLSFATDRPVFDLPAGYTINSPDAGIINNTFSVPVPEPVSSSVAAGVLLAMLRKRR